MIVFSGGTGTPKLLRGLTNLVEPSRLSVVVNTAEDIWALGNLISPDLDTVVYTLAGIGDEEKWWGIKGDTHHTSQFLRSLGCRELMALGDKDRAINIFRSELLRHGRSLSRATEALTKALGIKNRVIPMTDDRVSTMIRIPEGEIHLQEFWVGRKGQPEVLALRYHGIEDARPSPGFLELLDSEDEILIGPSNPVTSIGPILFLPGVRERLKGKRILAVSPLVGNKPVSGPVAKFMKAFGVPANDEGVKTILGDIGTFVVDRGSSYAGECVRLDILMRTGGDSLRLARDLVGLISCS
jgi:LPPG:FO 2-phospho-L-lactate transferase